MSRSLVACFLVALLVGCGEQPQRAPQHPQEATSLDSNGSDTQAAAATPTAAQRAAAVLPALGQAAASSGAAGLRPRSLDSIRWMVRAGEHQRAIQGLRFSLDHYTTAPDRNAALYMLGKYLTDAGEAEGLAILEQLPAPFEDHDDRRLLWLARAHRLNGNTAEALAALDQILDRYGDIPEAEDGDLAIEQAELLHAVGRTDDAIAKISKVLDAKTPRHISARALWLKAEWVRPTAPEDALAYEKRMLIDYPAELATREAQLNVKVEDLSDSQRYRRARKLMSRWAYVEARPELERLVDHKRYGLDAKWHAADISMNKLRDDIEGPRKLYEELIKKKGEYQENAYFQLIRTYLKQERYDEGLEIGDRYLKKFPRGKYKENIYYYKGWLPYDHKKCEDALPHLKYYIDNYGARRSIVRGFYAWCFIRLERWDEAVDAFEELIGYGNPVVRGKAQFWQAYAFQKLGKMDKAHTKLDRLHANYPLTYYDILGHQLRAQWEGRDSRASQMDWPVGGGDADVVHAFDDAMWDWPELRSRQRRALEEIRRLVELSEIDLARTRYRSIRSSVEKAVPKDKRHMFMLFIGDKVEDYMHGWRSVTNGKLAAMTDMPEPQELRWLLAYPQAYRPLIERFARKYDLPEHLVYAIMRQESRYRPWQISSADALGALQMIPKTAKRVAEDMGTTFNVRLFFRPEVGFEYSFFYIRSHYDTWQQQLVPTAASYNGGPEPIGRWMRQSREVKAPLSFMIEEFAYNESRIYCRKVAEHMLRYLYLYEPDPERRGRYLDELFPVEVDYNIPDDVGY